MPLAGGFVVQSLVAYWFHVRFGVEPAVLGSIFFGANVFAGISALLAGASGRAHWPHQHDGGHSHPKQYPVDACAADAKSAAGDCHAAGAIQYLADGRATRQSYTMAVVDPDERSAASGVTTIARSLGAALSPVHCGCAARRFAHQRAVFSFGRDQDCV